MKSRAQAVTSAYVSGRHAKIDAANLGDNEIIAAKAGVAFLVVAYTIQNSGAATVTTKWKSGASMDLTGPQMFPNPGDGGSIAECKRGHFMTAPGEALMLNLSAAEQVGGHVTYEEVEE
jgi:hypothetical protein